MTDEETRTLKRGKCPKCGYDAAITKNGKWYRHAAARGAYAIRGSSDKNRNICPNSGRLAILKEERDG